MPRLRRGGNTVKTFLELLYPRALSEALICLLLALPLTVFSQVVAELPSDRWDWTLESADKVLPHSLTMYQLRGGEVLVTYEMQASKRSAATRVYKMLGNTRSQSGRRIDDARIDDNGGVVFGDGSRQEIIGTSNAEIQFKNGDEISLFDRRALNKYCFRGPFPWVFDVFRNGTAREYAVMRILPRPLIFSVRNVEDGGKCPDEATERFRYRVDAVHGLMLPVGPNMFLLEVEPGVLIKFRSDFYTQSPLLNRRYFVWDLEGMANQVESLQKAGSHQQMMNQLLRTLSEINGEKRHGN